MGNFTRYVAIEGTQIRVTQSSPPELKFWSHVNKNGPVHPTLGKCWLWEGCSTPKHYGKVTVYGVRMHAHRYSWIIHNGSVQNGMWVLHACDNPNCVNPSHLFLGTHDDNMEDMAKKGRSGRAKLSEEQVREIRRRFQRGKGRGRYGSNGGPLAKEFGITVAAVRNVAERRAYKHVS